MPSSQHDNRARYDGGEDDDALDTFDDLRDHDGSSAIQQKGME